MTDASVPEDPWVDDVMKVAEHDLDAARGVLQRLLTTQDALLATAVSVTTLLTGLAITNHAPLFSGLGLPFVGVLAYLDAVAKVHTGRITQRSWRIEELFARYVKALRERDVARPAALSDLRRAIDQYQFGIERAFEEVQPKHLRREVRRQARWWLFPCMFAVLLVATAVAWPKDRSSPVCVAADGGIVRLNKAPERVSGKVTLVPCPKAAAPKKPVSGAKTTPSSKP